MFNVYIKIYNDFDRVILKVERIFASSLSTKNDPLQGRIMSNSGSKNMNKGAVKL